MLRSIFRLSHPRLRAVLALSLMVIFLLPAILAGYAFYQYTQRWLTDDVESELTMLANQGVRETNLWIGERSADLSAMGRISEISESVSAVLRNGEDRCRELQATLEDDAHIFGPGYLSFEILRLGGEQLCADRAHFEPDRRAFARAQTGAIGVSGRELANVADSAKLEIYVPIVPSGQPPQAVLAGTVLITPALGMFNGICHGSADHVHLVDSDGNMLDCSPWTGYRSTIHTIDQHDPPGSPTRNRGVERYRDERGVEVVGTRLPIPDLEWDLVVEREVEEAFGQLAYLRGVLWLLLGGVFVVGGMLSLTISTAVVRRLERREHELRTTHEQLITADRLASVGMMAASIAHEINNPLTTIKVLIHSLRARATAEVSHTRDLGIVLAEIDKIKSLVLRFLQFARPRDPEFSTVRLDEILTRIASLVRPQAQIQGLFLFEEYDRSAPAVWVDGSQIGQVFLNILLNAVDATPVGGEIRISTKADSANTVTVTIWNAGSSIPENLEGRIFEPFFSTKATGTGLGLSIARTIVEKHNGIIWAKGHGEDKGTSFMITLHVSNKEAMNASRPDRG